MSRYPGWEKWMPPHLQPKRRKFNNTPTEVDSVTFASKREADRYLVLRDMAKTGEIRALQLQPKFALHVIRPDGVKVQVGTYTADFQYERNGAMAYEDAKGVKTESYQMRKRHVEAEYNVTILET